MFDTHAHLDDEKFDNDREEVIAALSENGITTVVNAASDLQSSLSALSLANKYSFIYSAAGVHPHETKGMTNEILAQIEHILKTEKKCVALGEIGLDYYYDLSERETQLFWFDKQMQLAQKLNVPVIIHDRDAHEDCFNIIKKYDVKGVFHCFSGSTELAKKLVDMGWSISFTGVLTFKNARRAIETAKAIDINKIFIETDCPYMAPEPYRGTRNEPKYVAKVCEKLAEIKGLSVTEVENITETNAKKFFGIA